MPDRILEAQVWPKMEDDAERVQRAPCAEGSVDDGKAAITSYIMTPLQLSSR
jgi:hypothetical protein